MDVKMVLLEQLVASKHNARQTFNKEQDADLLASIKEKGVLVPLILRKLVDGDLEIVAGHRRYHAAKQLGLKEVPAEIRELSDREAHEIQIIENLQRADLHPMEEAEAFVRLLKQAHMTPAEVALKVGKSEKYIRQRIVLTNLIPKIAERFKANEIGIGVAFVAAREQKPHQEEFAKDSLRSKNYVPDQDDAERFFENYHLVLKDAAFDPADDKLLPEAGACTTCTKRSGNSMLFAEISEDTCTDAACFRKKETKLVQIRVAANPKAVKLSAVRDYSNEKLIGERQWVPAGNKVCDDIKQGVLVQKERFGIYNVQNVPLGKVLDVCVNPKCKVHRPATESTRNTGNTRAALTPAEKKARAAERIAVQVDRKAFDLMVAELRSNPKRMGIEDIRRVALSVCGDYSFKYKCVWLAPAFGLRAEGKSDSQAGADGQEHLKKFLKTAKAVDLQVFLVASELTPTFNYHSNSGGRGLMRKAAQRFGVKVAQIQQMILKAKAAKAKAAAKPKKAAKAPAKAKNSVNKARRGGTAQKAKKAA